MEKEARLDTTPQGLLTYFYSFRWTLINRNIQKSESWKLKCKMRWKETAFWFPNKIRPYGPTFCFITLDSLGHTFIRAASFDFHIGLVKYTEFKFHRWRNAGSFKWVVCWLWQNSCVQPCWSFRVDCEPDSPCHLFRLFCLCSMILRKALSLIFKVWRKACQM